MMKKILEYQKSMDLLFRANRKEVNKANLKMLKRISIITAILPTLLFFASNFVDILLRLRIFYSIFAIAFIFEAVLVWGFAAKNKISVRPMFHIQIITIYAFGILLGTVMSKSLTATMFMVFLIAVPTTFIERTQITFLKSTAATIIFLILSYNFKSEIFTTDLVNVVACYFIGNFLSFFITEVRLTDISIQKTLKMQCGMDELTGLPNRRSFNQFMKANKEIFGDDERDVSVMMIDVDDFKAYNDFYGHLTGDDALSAIAKTFHETGEKHNLMFARFGGEEFIATYIDSNDNTVKEVCEELIGSVRALNISHEKSKYERVTISIGVASKKETHAKNDIELINFADNALYESKTKGKNTFSFAENKN